MYKLENDLGQLIKSMHHLSTVYQRIQIPLEKQNAIVLEPEKSLADAYIEFFASGKSYTNSETFCNDCLDGKVLDGLVKHNLLVIITSVKLPINQYGKKNRGNYKKDNMDFNEYMNVAKSIRCNKYNLIPNDTPILFYSHLPNQVVNGKIANVPGIVCHIQRSFSNNPTYDILAGKLHHARIKAFVQEKNRFREAVTKFESTWPQYIKNPDVSQLINIFKSV